MYNEATKTRFIREYTGSLNTASVAETVFNALEKYEQGWGADLCTKGCEELQPVIDEIVGLRSKSKWMTLTILKEYVKWCIAMKIPGACDGMLKIQSVEYAEDLAETRRQLSYCLSSKQNKIIHLKISGYSVREAAKAHGVRLKDVTAELEAARDNVIRFAPELMERAA